MCTQILTGNSSGALISPPAANMSAPGTCANLPDAPPPRPRPRPRPLPPPATPPPRADIVQLLLLLLLQFPLQFLLTALLLPLRAQSLRRSSSRPGLLWLYGVSQYV